MQFSQTECDFGIHSQLKALKFGLKETLQKQWEEALDANKHGRMLYSDLMPQSTLEEIVQEQQEEVQDPVDQLSMRFSNLEKHVSSKVNKS